jgi:hypothetical protein
MALVIVATKLCPGWVHWKWDLAKTVGSSSLSCNVPVPWTGTEVDEFWRTEDQQRLRQYLDFCEVHLKKNAACVERCVRVFVAASYLYMLDTKKHGGKNGLKLLLSPLLFFSNKTFFRFSSHVNSLRQIVASKTNTAHQEMVEHTPKRTIQFGKCADERRQGDDLDSKFLKYKPKTRVVNTSTLHLPYAFILHRGAKLLDVAPDTLHKEVHLIDVEVEKMGLLGKECREFMEPH